MPLGHINAVPVYPTALVFGLPDLLMVIHESLFYIFPSICDRITGEIGPQGHRDLVPGITFQVTSSINVYCAVPEHWAPLNFLSKVKIHLVCK